MQSVVYILDDDEAIRASLTWLVTSAGLEVVSCASASELMRSIDKSRPGCIVLDVRMPEMGGFEVQSIVAEAFGHIPIIFVSAHGDIPMSVRAMKKGAFDFIEKPYNSQLLLERIQEAARAAVVQFDRSIKRQAVESRVRLLSPREKEVLQKVLEGKASKLIARELGISVKTVDIHRTSIREKLGASSLTQLVKEMAAHFHVT